MTDAQNERTKSRNRRRGRQRNRGEADAPPVASAPVQPIAPPDPPILAKPVVETAPFVRPADIAPPSVRSEEYCVHHTASFAEHGPMQQRSGMATLRHLQVDHFGEATLYCDCLHNGPHEWPPSIQRLHTAVELDQFLNASTNEA